MNAIQTLLTDHLDIWTAADTEKKSGRGRSSGNAASVYGIKKLREVILELAVRGKLVPQDPNDEPASALLPKVLKENARLLKEKNKKQSEAPEITDGDITFQLPKGWEYVRNGSLFSLRKGKKPTNISESEIGLPYLDIEALDRNNVLRFTDDDKCPRTTEADILVVCDGSRSGLVLDGKNGVIGSTLAVIDTPKLIRPFIKLLFMESYERMNSTMKGAAIPHLDSSRLILEVVGLPPLNEQYRIIAKVDELMAMCDRLEQQQTHSIEIHQALVEILLGTLTRVASQQEFSAAWARIASYFDTLFTTEASIAQLKRTILQLAVMGKLVPQDPNDELASVLLEKTAKEKERLIKEGIIRKQKPLPEINDEEVSFNTPDGWAWSRMGNLAEYQKGYAFNSKDYLDCGLMITKIQNLTENHIQNSVYIAPERAAEFDQYLLCEGDVVMTTVGSWFSAPISAVGRSFLINKLFDHSLLNQNAVRIRPWKELNSMYLFACINSPIFKNYLVQEAQGTANQASITQESIKNFLICVPPRAEQHRIVAKVDELMALCDALKARLADAQAIQLHLADAIVEQAVC